MKNFGFAAFAAGLLVVLISCQDPTRLPRFTVSFDLNGGGGTAPAPRMVEVGSATTLPNASGFSKAGYDFGWWATNTDGTGTVHNAGSQYTPSGDRTMFARWVTQGTFMISFNANGGSGTVPALAATQGHGVPLPGAEGLIRTGQTFASWNTSPDGTGTNHEGGSTFVPLEHVTLYARWVPTVAVAFNVNGGLGAVPSLAVGQGLGVTLPGSDGLSRTGYAFAGWNTLPNGMGVNHDAGYMFVPQGNTVLYARWLPGFTVTFSANGGAGAVPAQVAVIGLTITLPSGAELSRPGHVLVGWNENAAGTGTNHPAGSSFAPTANITLYARWLASGAAFTVTFNANGGEGIVPAQSVAIGSAMTLPSGAGFSRPGYLFGGWNRTTAGAGTNYPAGMLFMPTANITLYASWELPQLTGTVSIIGNTIIGQTLTANVANLGGSGDISFQWRRGMHNVGSNSGTYVVQPTDLGQAITVTVTRAGNSGEVISAPTGLVPFPLFRDISAGGHHTVGICEGGMLWSWGRNNVGQLGDGTTTQRTRPWVTDVTSDRVSNWASVSASRYHTVAVRTDGTLWAWGNNSFGQLGDGTLTQRHSPVRIGTASNWVSVSTSRLHTVAIRADGTLWAWGSNLNAQLGDGTRRDSHSPLRIGTASDWASVSAGELHNVAIKTDGTLWAWGSNWEGQIGDGTRWIRDIPVRIGTDNDWVSAYAGLAHNVAVRTDGTLWAWGFNSSGQIGDGTTTNRHSPVQIGADGDWASAYAGPDRTFAIRTDGTLWAWGWNGNGRLGDGTTTRRPSPVQIGTDGDWASVSTGGSHNVAERTDGTLWAWGWNGYGGLGDGTTTQRHSPILISR